MATTSTRVDVYTRVTSQIVDQLEAGVRPWLKPWNAKYAAGRITRPLRHNGQPYKGINILMLWASAELAGYACPFWLTFQQCKELGGFVKKGEHGSPVVYANTFKKTETTDEGAEVEQEIPFLKQYTVFNAVQCEELPPHYYQLAAPPVETLERIERAEARPARFYMLQCTHENGRRCATIRTLDPLLEQFDSEYHYLFACVHHAAVASPAPPLEQNYMLPNLARRLLEAFLAFRQPHIAGELWQKLQLVTFDETKKIKIIRFLHTHSHNAALGEPEHDLSLLSEAQAILKDLLSLMESQDSDHFNAMKSLVAPAAEDAADEPSAAGHAAAAVV